MSFTNYLYGRRLFWRFRLLLESGLLFGIFKNLTYAKRFVQKETDSILVLKSFATTFLFYLLYGILFVALVEALGRTIPFKLPITLDYQVAKDLIGTIVTVIGVFLGLYFTAVSAVAGSLFMRATVDLQELFLRDWRNQQFIKTLGLTTIIGIYYLGMSVVGYHFSVIGLVALILLAVYAAITILALGFRTFYFIHPIEASVTLARDAARAIDSATAGKLGWRKPYLQEHFRRQSESALATLDSLINFGIEAIKLSDEQFVAIARYVGRLLVYYIENRKRIASTSGWHRPKQQFQNWVLASSSEIAIALNTGTPLSPKSVPDEAWFEERCVETILKVFHHFLSRRQWESSIACIEILVMAAERSSAELYDGVGKMLVKKVGGALEQGLAAIGPSTDAHDQKLRLALVDSYGRFGIALLLGYLRHVNQFDPEKLASTIQEIDWLRSTGIYSCPLPGKLLPNLEKTSQKCRTERAIEGELRSPAWYLATITAQDYLFELKAYRDFVVTLHGSIFQKTVRALVQDKKPLAAANMVQRWLEFLDKLSGNNADLRQLSTSCERFRLIHDLPWPDFNDEQQRVLLAGWNKDATDQLIQLIPVLNDPSSEGATDLPDYFGQAYTFGVEACYQACVDNDHQRFARIFPIVFYGSLTAFDSTRKQTRDWTQDSQIIFSSEPLEDLLAVSGYAHLYAELYQDESLWKVCESTWNDYLTKIDARNTIGLIATMFRYRDTKFAVMPKAILRTNWDTTFESKIRELGPAADDEFGIGWPGRRPVVHPSPVIRAVARLDPLPLNRARNLFLATYLSKHAAAEGIEFPDSQSIAEEIERESRSSTDEESETEEL